jgi:hypothetical protein
MLAVQVIFLPVIAIIFICKMQRDIEIHDGIKAIFPVITIVKINNAVCCHHFLKTGNIGLIMIYKINHIMMYGRIFFVI